MCSIQKFESSDHQTMCFICYKTCGETKYAEVLKSFKKFAGRYIGKGFEISLNAAEIEFSEALKGGDLICCNSCSILMRSFCEIYDHLKYWELRLEWRLRGILDIMKLANRVPSRVKHLKQLFLEEPEQVGNELQNKDGIARLKSFKKFRADAVLKCSHKLSSSFPKVLVTRIGENYGCPASIHNPIKIDHKSEPQNLALPMVEEWLLKWVISLVTVGMLLVIPLQNFTADLFYEEQITTLDKALPGDIFESEDLSGSPNEGSNSIRGTTEIGYQSSIINKLNTFPDQPLPSLPPRPEVSSAPRHGTKHSNNVIQRKRTDRYNKFGSSPIGIFNCGLCKFRQRSYQALKIHKLTSRRHKILMGVSRKTNQEIRVKQQRFVKVTSNSSFNFTPLAECKIKKEFINEAQQNDSLIKSENKDDINTFSNFKGYNLRQNNKRLYSQIDEESESKEGSVDSDSETTDPDTDLSSCYLPENEETVNDKTKQDTSLSSEKDEIKVLECDVCKLKVPEDYIAKHFNRWHDTKSQNNDSKDVRKCPNSECRAYFMKGKNAKGAYRQLALHMKQVHNISLRQINTKKIKIETSEVEIGESEHKSVSMHECLKCQALGIHRNFRLLCNYQDHQKFHKEGKFQCNFCDQTKKDIVALSIHQINSHSNIYNQIDSKEPAVFKCPRCETEHCSKWMYVEHFADTHIPNSDFTSPEARVECDVCQYEIKKYYLGKHFDCFHDKRNLGSEEMLKCTQSGCSAYFVWKTSKAWAERQLRYHSRQVHGNIDEFKKFDFDNNPSISKNKKSGYKCNRCGNSFAKKRGIYNHIMRCRRRNITSCKSTRTNTLFQCPLDKCTSHFRCRKDLDKHKKFHGKFSCKFCTVVKDFAPDLALHEVNEHSEKVEDSNFMNCSRCPSKFHIKPAYCDHFLETHLKLEVGTTGYCDICGAETTASRKDKFLKLHFRDFHKIDRLGPTDIHRCDQCPAYFIKPLQLYLHKMNIHYKRRCPGCGKSYKTLPQLKYHMEVCQPDSVLLPFACDAENCTRKFSSAERLDQHKKTCRQKQPGRIYKCTKCSKQYKKYGVLTTHLRQAHGPKSFLCSECGKGFPSKTRLELHFKLHEETDRDKFKFQCVQCGKKFRVELTLERHMGTHTNEKPFVCQYCGNSYKHNVGLTRHVKASHKGKPSGLNDVTANS